MQQVTGFDNSTTHVFEELTYRNYPARRVIKSWGIPPFRSEAQIREEMNTVYTGVERRVQPWRRS
jgi:hypothetical protein